MTIKSKIFILVTVILIVPMLFKAWNDYRTEIREVTDRTKAQMHTVVQINTVTNQNFMWSRGAVIERLGKHFEQLPMSVQKSIIEVGADGLDATMALLNQKLLDTMIWYSWGEKIQHYVEAQGDDFSYRQLPKDMIDQQVLNSGEPFYGIVEWDGDESIYPKGRTIFRGAFPVRIMDKTDVSFRDKTISYVAVCARCHINDMSISPTEPMAVVSVAFDMEPTLAAAKKKLIRSVVTYLILNVVILAILITLLNKLVFAPISDLQARFQDMVDGDGDLTKRLPEVRNDEIGILSHQFNQFIGNIQKVIRDVDVTSNTLATSSEELFATSREIDKTTIEVNRGIDDANHSLQQTGQSINDLAGNIAEINKSIAEVQSMAQRAEREAKEGTASVEATNQSIKKIEESSKKIVGIMDVISEISKQTNLLSLNAAIEAAKAGEFGKGFAVVADEVRNLSERSSDATEKIQRLIEISYANVYEGIQVIQKTGVTLNGIITSVNQIFSQINRVADRMAEQQQRTSNLASIAEQLTVNSESNAVAMNELSETIKEVDMTTESLSKLAETLRAQVATFKVE